MQFSFWGQNITTDALGNIFFVAKKTRYDIASLCGVSSPIGTNIWRFFLVKLDAAGNCLWTNEYEDHSMAQAHALAVDGAGNCYFTSNLGGLTTFGSFTLDGSGAPYQHYLVKVNPTGQVIWAITTNLSQAVLYAGIIHLQADIAGNT